MLNEINVIQEVDGNQETIIQFYLVDFKNISPSSVNTNSVLPIYKNQIIETTLPVAELTCHEPLKTYDIKIKNYQPKSIDSWELSLKKYQSIQGILYSCDTDFINKITINSINNKNIKINNATRWQANSFLIDKDFDFISTSNYVFVPYYPNTEDGEQQKQPVNNLSENEFEEMILSSNANDNVNNQQTYISNNKNMDFVYGFFILMMLLSVAFFLKKKKK